MLKIDDYAPPPQQQQKKKQKEGKYFFHSTVNFKLELKETNACAAAYLF